MTREDLIANGSHKVRRSEDLMAFYLQEFERIFGRKPNCAACTFVSDWKRFEKGKDKQQTFIKMKKTFELTSNAKNIIHTYRSERKPIRTYGYKMTEQFAKAYLSIGTYEQIEGRKKHFKVLPMEVEEKQTEHIIVANGEEVFLSEATGKQMTAYAQENNIDLSDARLVADKRDVILKSL